MLTPRGDLLGDLLVESKAITAEQLAAALRHQADHPDSRIGQILVRSGVLPEEKLYTALAVQAGMEFLADPMAEKPEHEAFDAFGINFCRGNGVLPVRKDPEKNTIRVVVADPLNGQLIGDIEAYFRLRADAALTTPGALDKAINACFEEGSASEAERAIGEFGEGLGDGEGGGPIDLLDATDEAPIIRLINSLIFQAVRDRASDLHFEPFESELVVRFRIDGVLYPVLRPPKQAHPSIVSRIKIMAGLNIAERRLPQDGRIRLKIAGRDIDIRVSTLPTYHGERVVLRLLERSGVLLDLQDTGFESSYLSVWAKLIERPHGIILVTGPTGSGKTTTLYASLSQINKPDQNIITIEDPVEYELPGVGQIQVNPKIELTFASGLRAILRQDPDVILVGEIRDLETAEIAIQASLTGHLVFSTLHTNDAPGAITRLVDMGVEAFLVSSSLLAVCAQRLVRKLCRNCAEPYTPTEAEITEVGLKPTDIAGRTILREGTADCPVCSGVRYKGRTGIHELLVLDDELRQMILESADAVSLRRRASAKGMKNLRDSGASKVLSGVTSIEEVLRVTQEEVIEDA